MTYQPGTYPDGVVPITKAQIENIEAELVDLDARGMLLTGYGPPTDRADLGPTSGSWGWSGPAGAWFSPAYPVSWVDGDDVAAAAAAGSNIVYVATGPAGVTPVLSVSADADHPYQYSSAGLNTTGTAGNAGSGVILIRQSSPGGPGTGPVQPTLSPLDYLGDVQLLSTTPVPYATDPGTGKDGDYYLDASPGGSKLYGPRTDGVWGAGASIGLDPALAAAITGRWVFSKLVFTASAAGGSPLVSGQATAFFDSTAGSPVILFRGRDSAGAYYIASLPMTAE